ncbi:MAG: DUF4290 domain-containing protein [Luteibaculaceae bacterium]
MQYNTQRKKLALPEYGRSIHEMVEYCITLPTKEERNVVANTIIKIMGQLNPHLRDTDDYAHKLWDHLFIMSDFRLDVDSPYPIPSMETFRTKPETIPYPTGGIKYGYYGLTMQKMIAKCAEMPDGEEKDAFTTDIANSMKKFFLQWNRETLGDEVIITHLNELSKGKLSLGEDEQLKSNRELIGKKPQDSNNARRKKKSPNKKYKKHYRQQ